MDVSDARENCVLDIGHTFAQLDRTLVWLWMVLSASWAWGVQAQIFRTSRQLLRCRRRKKKHRRRPIMFAKLNLRITSPSSLRPTPKSCTGREEAQWRRGYRMALGVEEGRERRRQCRRLPHVMSRLLIVSDAFSMKLKERRALCVCEISGEMSERKNKEVRLAGEFRMT